MMDRSTNGVRGPAGPRRGGRGGAAPLLGTLAAALWLAACTALPGFGAPPELFTLTPASGFEAATPRVAWQLLVERPAAAAGLDTARIALRGSPTTLDYFAGVTWTDRAPQMVQDLLVESFENSGRIVSVGRDTGGLRADYLLKTELREFQAEYSGDRRDQPPRIRVRLAAKLVSMPHRIIEASDAFEAMVTARSNNFDDIIAAYNEALGKVMKRTVEWTLTHAAA